MQAHTHACMHSTRVVKKHAWPCPSACLSAHASDWLSIVCAADYEKHVALQLNRSVRLAEGRARILNAVRQTYVDFLHDKYISGQQLYHLQVICLQPVTWPLSLSCTQIAAGTCRYTLQSSQLLCLHVLQDSADRAVDELDTPLGDWAHLSRGCKLPRWVKRTVE